MTACSPTARCARPRPGPSCSGWSHRGTTAGDRRRVPPRVRRLPHALAAPRSTGRSGRPGAGHRLQLAGVGVIALLAAGVRFGPAARVSSGAAARRWSTCARSPPRSRRPGATRWRCGLIVQGLRRRLSRAGPAPGRARPLARRPRRRPCARPRGRAALDDAHRRHPTGPPSADDVLRRGRRRGNAVGGAHADMTAELTPLQPDEATPHAAAARPPRRGARRRGAGAAGSRAGDGRRPARPRPRAARGRARHRQDAAGAGARPALGLEFRRIQFTPDLMPSDITGVSLLTRPGQLQLPPGADLRRPGAGRRDQPRARPRPRPRCSRRCRSGG